MQGSSPPRATALGSAPVGPAAWAGTPMPPARPPRRRRPRRPRPTWPRRPPAVARSISPGPPRPAPWRPTWSSAAGDPQQFHPDRDLDQYRV